MARPTYLIFGMIKDAENIYDSIKNQVRGLSVGGDRVILPWNKPTNKMTISPPTHNSRT